MPVGPGGPWRVCRILTKLVGSMAVRRETSSMASTGCMQWHRAGRVVYLRLSVQTADHDLAAAPGLSGKLHFHAK